VFKDGTVTVHDLQAIRLFRNSSAAIVSIEQVCVQLPASAKNRHCPHLLLWAVLRRAVAAPAVQQSIDISWAHSSKRAARCCSGRMGQTDGQTNIHRNLLRVLCWQWKKECVY